MKEPRKTREGQRGPLALCVQAALERYFQDLDGEKPGALYDMVLEQVEPPLLEAAMDYANGNQSQAAKLLGINRNTLRKKLKAHGLD